MKLNSTRFAFMNLEAYKSFIIFIQILWINFLIVSAY